VQHAPDDVADVVALAQRRQLEDRAAEAVVEVFAEAPGADQLGQRLVRGTPVLVPEDDVYTNHIHADDLARACVAALLRGRPQRVVNTCDRSELTMGEYFDLAADLCGLPRPPRITRAQAESELSPMLLSFMSESRRLRNRRLERELRLRLRYPTVHEGLRDG
jgi:nucleoside-diphosphate-sugar epimerase